MCGGLTGTDPVTRLKSNGHLGGCHLQYVMWRVEQHSAGNQICTGLTTVTSQPKRGKWRAPMNHDIYTYVVLRCFTIPILRKMKITTDFNRTLVYICRVTTHCYVKHYIIHLCVSDNNNGAYLPWMSVQTQHEKYHCFCDLVNFFYENITMITSVRPLVFVGPIGKFWEF